MVLMTSGRYIIKQALKLGFKASNNEAGYEALLARLRIAAKLQVKEQSVH